MPAQDRPEGIAFLGAGRMAEALVRGLCAADRFAADRLRVYDIQPSRVRALQDAYGVRGTGDPIEAVEGADVVILAVKPQHLAACLEPVHGRIEPHQLVVSIAAGVRTERIEQLLPAGQPVVRVMPNTPALVGAGAAGVTAGRSAGEAHVAVVKSLFEAVGIAISVDERLLDVVTGLSGSGPAFVCLMIEALADGAVAEGLDRANALKLAAQTVAGTGRMVLESDVHPAELRDGVTSPGGTTAAGLEMLEAGAVRAAVSRAVRAAAGRAAELADA